MPTAADSNGIPRYVETDVGTNGSFAALLNLALGWVSDALTNFKGTHTDVRRRVMTAGNLFTTADSSEVGIYKDFPQTADAAALTISFAKARAASKLVIRASGICEMSTGQLGSRATLGVRINTTDYDVAVAAFPAGGSGARRTFVGEIEVSGLAAGTYAIRPRFKAGYHPTTFGFYTSDDMVSLSVTETN